MDISTVSEFLEHQSSLGCSCLQCQAKSLPLGYADTEKGAEHRIMLKLQQIFFTLSLLHTHLCLRNSPPTQ